MKQADLLADIHQNYHEYLYRNYRRDPSKKLQYQRKLMIFRVRMKGIHRGRAAGREIRRQMDRRIRPTLFVPNLSLEIVTGPDSPLLMWEQVEMASALGRDSPVHHRWGDVREYERANLKQSLEVSLIVWIAPNRNRPKQKVD